MPEFDAWDSLTWNRVCSRESAWGSGLGDLILAMISHIRAFSPVARMEGREFAVLLQVVHSAGKFPSLQADSSLNRHRRSILRRRSRCRHPTHPCAIHPSTHPRDPRPPSPHKPCSNKRLIIVTRKIHLVRHGPLVHILGHHRPHWNRIPIDERRPPDLHSRGPHFDEALVVPRPRVACDILGRHSVGKCGLYLLDSLRDLCFPYAAGV